MSNIFLDSNIFIYAGDFHSSFFEKSKVIIESLVQKDRKGIITPFVLNEIQYIFFKQFGREYAAAKIEEILELPHIELQNYEFKKGDIKDVLHLSVEFNLHPTDSYHVFYCKLFDITSIATFDTAFKKIPWLSIYTGKK